MQNAQGPHLEVDEVAAYVDRRLAGTALARVETHLAECETCRGEVIQVSRLTRSVPQRRRWFVWVPAAAAAAVLLIVLTPGGVDRLRSPHRDQAVTTTLAPVPIGPVGRAPPPVTLRWSSVAKADRYQLTLYDSAASVLWKYQTGDTTVTLPDSVRLRTGQWYYWRVEARTGVGRWAASGLVSFTVAASPR